MVIETPEGLTLVEPAENSSFYIVQEHEGQETPPGTIKLLVRLKLCIILWFNILLLHAGIHSNWIRCCARLVIHWYLLELSR